MALKATIFKADLQITDLDRNYYQNHSLTIARHPSETDERMMVRVCAFAKHANERLEFSKGLSSDDEPALWQKDLSEQIELWIDVGQPDEKRIRKACSRAQQVVIYCYAGRSAKIWWEQIKNKLTRFNNLKIIYLTDESVSSMAELTQRNMSLQCTIQDGQLWIVDTDKNLQIDMEHWL